MKVILEEYLQGIAAAGERIARCELGMRDLLEKWRLAPVKAGRRVQPEHASPRLLDEGCGELKECRIGLVL